MGAPIEGDSSTVQPGVTGRNSGKASPTSTGVFGSSVTGEGVHGETSSTTFAAVAGIELNSSSNVAAVYGEQRGGGPGVFGIAKGNGTGVFGTSANGEGVHGETSSTTFAAVAGIELNSSSNIAAVYGEQRGGGPGVFGIAKGNGAGVFGTSASGEGVHGETTSAGTAAVAGIMRNPKGTGAGVYGESQGQGPAGFFKGNVVVTGDIALASADCAEDFDVAVPEEATPGTVMALGPDGALVPAQEEYDRRVLGIVSGAGRYKPAIILDRQTPGAGRACIALLGKVCVKVDAQYGAVEPGDLLTSSSTPGYAMKASDPLRAFGAVIGKALDGLHAGRGMIAALVNLQ
jgi:hypothetical protein